LQERGTLRILDYTFSNVAGKEWVTPTCLVALCSIVLAVIASVSFSMLASLTIAECESGL
jgi:hypothetical protein